MRHILLRIVVTAFSLLLVAEFVPGIHVNSLMAAILGAFVLGVITVCVRPILVILTLPVTILTLGLFLFVINAFLFLWASSLVPGFTVSGFVPALIGSLVVSVCGAIVNKV